jgi:flagellar motor switch protein FliG
MDAKKLAGPLKVAMLINALDEKASQAVLGTLSPSEQEKIKRLLPQVNGIPVEIVDKVAQEFIEQARGGEPESAGTKKTEKFGSIASAGTPGQKALGRLGIAQFMDSDQLVQLLQEEHPQTLALILSHLDSEVASEILAQLPSDQRADVAIRIAKLGKVNPWMLDEIEAYLASSDKQQMPAPTQAVGGLSQLAEILKRLDDDMAETIMEHIESNDDDLAEGINNMLFVFDDIVMVDDKGMQQVLRNVETQDLALALKAASDETQEKIFKNMSTRASAMLTEEIESMGPVRMADVTQAQQKITQIVQEMEKKGELIIQGRGGEEFIG